jgi:hydrogenase expression/formation protein HypE
LHEIASASGTEIVLDESRVPVSEPVHVACELLGLDPLFLASEGRLVAFVPAFEADAAFAAMRAHPLGTCAARIGEVGAAGRGRVVVNTMAGGRRLLERPAGEPLPRIC